MDSSPSGILDLTQKPTGPNERPTYGRPNLEIVRVPVVPRPTPLNLETRNHHQHVDHQPHYPPLHQPRITVASNLCKEVNNKPPSQTQAERKSQFVTGSVPPSPVGYANLLDSRAMATNNLEITLVSPKKTAGSLVGPPQFSPPSKNNHVVWMNHCLQSTCLYFHLITTFITIFHQSTCICNIDRNVFICFLKYFRFIYIVIYYKILRRNIG